MLFYYCKELFCFLVLHELVSYHIAHFCKNLKARVFLPAVYIEWYYFLCFLFHFIKKVLYCNCLSNSRRAVDKHVSSASALEKRLYGRGYCFHLPFPVRHCFWDVAVVKRRFILDKRLART